MLPLGFGGEVIRKDLYSSPIASRTNPNDRGLIDFQFLGRASVKRELRLRPTKNRLANFTPLRLCRYFNSYDNRFAAKWRRGFCWKKRSQNRKCLRYKRKENECGQCCTFHVRREEYFHRRSSIFSSIRYCARGVQAAVRPARITAFRRIVTTATSSRRLHSFLRILANASCVNKTAS